MKNGSAEMHPNPGFNAEGAEVLAKVAKEALSAFLCENLCVLCVEAS